MAVSLTQYLHMYPVSVAETDACLIPDLPPVGSVEKSPAVVRPKDSAPLLNLMEMGATVEESRSSFHEAMNFNDQTIYSYQQISCLDSVVRYL